MYLDTPPPPKKRQKKKTKNKRASQTTPGKPCDSGQRFAPIYYIWRSTALRLAIRTYVLHLTLSQLKALPTSHASVYWPWVRVKVPPPLFHTHPPTHTMPLLELMPGTTLWLSLDISSYSVEFPTLTWNGCTTEKKKNSRFVVYYSGFDRQRQSVAKENTRSVLEKKPKPLGENSSLSFCFPESYKPRYLFWVGRCLQNVRQWKRHEAHEGLIGLF